MDPVGTKLITANRPTNSVDRVATAQAVRPGPSAREDLGASTGLSAIVAELSVAPPVNQDRVAEIRKAIADRSYPILPETIADRMIALKLNWNPNEQA